MSVSAYERLLGELTEAKKADETGSVDKPNESLANLADLEDRLLVQQADLLNTAGTLRLSPPRLRPKDTESPTGTDLAEVMRQAQQHMDGADASIVDAVRAAELPPFMPTSRPLVRHATVYGLCALAGMVIQSLLIAGKGVTSAALGFAVAPLLAFAIGYLLVGHASRPRLRPATNWRKRTPSLYRHPKLGLIICVGVDLATAAWWLSGLEAWPGRLSSRGVPDRGWQGAATAKRLGFER